METKSFDLGTVLSVTTGRLLTKRVGERDNGISEMYRLLDWMTGTSNFTHQLGRAARDCGPFLLQWFPELESCGSEAELQRLDILLANNEPEEAVKMFVAKQIELGAKPVYDVPCIPQEETSNRDALEELFQMVGKEKVVVFTVPGE